MKCSVWNIGVRVSIPQRPGVLSWGDESIISPDRAVYNLKSSLLNTNQSEPNKYKYVRIRVLNIQMNKQNFRSQTAHMRGYWEQGGQQDYWGESVTKIHIGFWSLCVGIN